jgi:hypothetical protein
VTTDIGAPSGAPYTPTDEDIRSLRVDLRCLSCGAVSAYSTRCYRCGSGAVEYRTHTMQADLPGALWCGGSKNSGRRPAEAPSGGISDPPAPGPAQDTIRPSEGTLWRWSMEADL